MRRGVRAQEELLRARMDETVALSTLAAAAHGTAGGGNGTAAAAAAMAAGGAVVHTGYPQAYGESASQPASQSVEPCGCTRTCALH